MIKFFRQLFYPKKANTTIVEKYNFDTFSESANAGIKEPILPKGETSDVILPEFLSRAKEIKIIKFNFEVGDIVKFGDVLCEIETEDLTMEFESYHSGKVVYLYPLLKTNIVFGTKIVTLEGI